MTWVKYRHCATPRKKHQIKRKHQLDRKILQSQTWCDGPRPRCPKSLSPVRLVWTILKWIGTIPSPAQWTHHLVSLGTHGVVRPVQIAAFHVVFKIALGADQAPKVALSCTTCQGKKLSIQIFSKNLSWCIFNTSLDFSHHWADAGLLEGSLFFSNHRAIAASLIFETVLSKSLLETRCRLQRACRGPSGWDASVFG